MRVDEVGDEKVRKVVFTFGRLNPPHFGHHALIQTLVNEAKKQGADWFLFVSAKTGDEKNPLTYEQKIWWIQALYPETKGHIVDDASIKTPLIAATWLYKKGYRAATFVAGEDDMAGYGEMIKSGNAHGQKNPDAVRMGKGFVFEPLDFAISPRLASATNARKNVTDGDPESFVRSILGPKSGDQQLVKLVHDQLYPTLRKALGLGESVGESTLLNKRTPSVKELAKKFMTTPDAVHRQLARGVKVEFEHTNDIEVATEIALDHLGEKLDYYTRLAKAENESVGMSKKSFDENFADGKGPGRPGDSQRHGIPKKATIAQLEKASHAKGRKGQLARWQLNMRRGKKKANEEITNEVADQPYRFISPVSTATAQKSMFQTDSGTKMQVNIIVDQSSGTADVGFYDSTDKENPSIGMTGKGDAFRVFATVGAIVKQFVDKRKPPFLSFAGKTTDPGRIKLYDMIAKNIGRYLPDYKLIDSGFANGDKGYMFKRVAQESVSEGKKPKKPKTIIDGALKTLIAKGRSEDEAIADLKKEIDSKFYDLGESLEENRRVIKFLDGEIQLADHLKKRINEPDPARRVNPVLIGKMIEKARDQLGNKLKALQDEKFMIRQHNPPMCLGGLAQTRPDGSKIYRISTYRTILNVDPTEKVFNLHEAAEDVKPRVYLDMDGVLADFFGEWSRISGVDHYKDINDVEAKLQLVRDHPTFWIDLPMLPHARALVKTVIENYGEYRICSTPLEGDARSKPGKIEWIKKHLADMPPAEIVLTQSKADHAMGEGSPNILVDDYGVNINKWRSAGGVGIKYEDSAFPQVAKILVKLAKTGVSK